MPTGSLHLIFVFLRLNDFGTEKEVSKETLWFVRPITWWCVEVRQTPSAKRNVGIFVFNQFLCDSKATEGLSNRADVYTVNVESNSLWKSVFFQLFRLAVMSSNVTLVWIGFWSDLSPFFKLLDLISRTKSCSNLGIYKLIVPRSE
jgi:hypothetical protein